MTFWKVETLIVTMDREGSVVIRDSVGANTTIGTGINSTHETSRDFSNGGFIVNGSVEMDIDVLGNDQACTILSVLTECVQNHSISQR